MIIRRLFLSWLVAVIGMVDSQTKAFQFRYLPIQPFSRSGCGWRSQQEIHLPILPSRKTVKQFAMTSTTEIRNQLGLHDRFDRWRFLQNVLDEDIDGRDTISVLYAVLDAFVKYPERPAYKAGSDETGSPKLTPKLRHDILSILQQDASNTREIEKLLEPNQEGAVDEDMDNIQCTTEFLQQLERLLPDPIEDVDANKGLWDTVIEIHGRESVKINERNSTRRWRVRCAIARVLLHYDFLTLGLVETPLM